MTTAKLPLLLASTSKYRGSLLKQLQLEFEQQSPDFEERLPTGLAASKIATEFAIAKAKSLASSFPHHLIIGSDQIADLKGTILEKPGTPARAATQLRCCSGQSVIFHTAVATFNPQTNELNTHLDSTTVRFRELSNREIERYLEKEDVLNCCGSFKMEGLGISLFDSVETTDPQAIIGMPMIGLCKLLRLAHVPLP